MKLLKPKFWHKKNSVISFLLVPFSIFFQFLIILKKNLKTKTKFSIPVICVGNIYLGGTGKTPMCIELTKILEKTYKKIAIIRKFYKSHDDEFRLIESKNIKLFKDFTRAKAIKKAEVEKYDCAILDDGFQDSSIFKNLNIVCFNGEQLVGNEKTLPSGPLREPLSSLKDAQIIVVNGNVNEKFEKKIQVISNNIQIFYSEYLPVNLNQFVGQNLLAFAGIGNPNNFFKLLEDNNLKVKKTISFPDHYNYSFNELKDLIELSDKNNLRIITTEKDYFRIKNFKIPQIQYLIVKLVIKNKDKFEEEIIKCLS